ncbi:uncharacterized protein P174DRAFT_438264 [Aspergillus novofumigatus IBT 16806]|uniref:Uncharacterized protein n=1 Tax=Aspergillus novofumigatus (strain IBT 16806) TaxID=1392255 RepID=A0A2I1CFU1_ASPN1|nr:uncharacterized protein P174DRAFT_438264 [Aspergillus novofumigatus IBT 16806]PKX96492.1 hypothetical protein P174DRAFT_438264 [Aspergillus novofumigatus IBT 16806]
MDILTRMDSSSTSGFLKETIKYFTYQALNSAILHIVVPLSPVPIPMLLAEY